MDPKGHNTFSWVPYLKTLPDNWNRLAVASVLVGTKYVHEHERLSQSSIHSHL